MPTAKKQYPTPDPRTQNFGVIESDDINIELRQVK